MRPSDNKTETLNSLLRGELSAVETYNLALNRQDDLPGALDLIRIRNEHQGAADVLMAHVSQHGGMPASRSGPWGLVAQAVEGTAKLFGTRAALKALKEGEEHGIKVYERALQDPDLDNECKSLIGADFLPQQATHISDLNKLMTAC